MQKGAGTQKGYSKSRAKKKRPSLFIPNAGDVPVPFPLVRSECTFFWVGQFETNCYWEKRERGGGWQEGGSAGRWFSQKPEQNGVTKMSFDKKDIMLLSTP